MNLETRILHETSFGYVFRVNNNYFEVRINQGWNSMSDSAYADASLAISRLNYLTARRQPLNSLNKMP